MKHYFHVFFAIHQWIGINGLLPRDLQKMDSFLPLFLADNVVVVVVAAAAAVAVVVVVVVFAKANRTFEVLLMVALRVFSKGYHHFN